MADIELPEIVVTPGGENPAPGPGTPNVPGAGSGRRPQKTTRINQFEGQPIGEPQRSYNFAVELPSIGPRKPFVESVDTAPIFETIGPKPEPIGGRQIFSAITKIASNLTLSLYVDAVGNRQPTYTALEYIKKWQALVQNDDGTFNYPESNGGDLGYSKSIKLLLLMPDLNIGYEVEYQGCFPIQVSPLQFAYKDNVGRSRLSVTFSVDRIVPRMYSGGSQSQVQSAPNATNERPNANIQNLDVFK